MDYLIKNLYNQYSKDIYIYLIGLTHDQSLAEDLTSEVFISAIKSLPNFQGKSDIKTWLFSISRYKWYEYLRKNKKGTELFDKLQNYMYEEFKTTEDFILKSETISRINELLNLEKETHKKIIFMRIEGYSFLEISKACGVSENSARVIDFRTRKKLKETLIKEGFTYE